MLLANLSRRICSSSLYESTEVTLTSVIQISEDLCSIHQESLRSDWEMCQVTGVQPVQGHSCVHWYMSEMFLLWELFESNICICQALLQIDTFLTSESGMCILNICLNLCKGFWLFGRAEKELKLGALLDEITSASLASLWLHAPCHWIIIKHL